MTPPTITVSGSVADRISQQSVSQVKISYGNIQTFTDSAGYFSITIIFNQDFATTHGYLLAEADGYHTAKILLQPFSTPFLSVELVPIIFPLETVQVYGILENSNSISHPLPPYTLSALQLESLSRTEDIFQSLPGMIVKSYGGAGGIKTISLHGGQGERTAVMLNGMSIMSEQNGIADLSTLPRQIIGKIEYYPVGGSVRYGSSAMSGIINILPQRSPAGLQFSAGSYGERELNLHINSISPQNRLGLMMGSLSNKGDYPYLYDGEWYPRDHNRFKQDYLFYYQDHQLQEGGVQLNTLALTVFNDRDLPGSRTHPDDSRFRSDMTDQFTLLMGKVSSRRHSVQLGYRQFKMTYDPYFGFTSDHDLKSLSLSYFLTRSFLNVQVNFQKDRIVSSNVKDTTRFTLSGHLEAKYPGRVYTAVTSLGGEISGQRKFLSAEFILSRIFPGPVRNITLTFSQNYRRPTLNDLYWTPGGNPRLKLEQSRNLHLLTSFSGGSRFNGGLDFYYIHYDNLIRWVSEGVFSTPENISTAMSNGTTLHLKYYSNTYSITSVNIDYNKTAQLSGDQNGKPLLYSPAWVMNFSQSLICKAWIFSLTAHYESRKLRMYGSPDDLYLPAIKKFDMNLSRRQLIHNVLLKTEFSISNLSDENYETIYGYPEPGRSYRLNIELTQTEREK